MTKVAAVIRADHAAEAERQSRMALENGADLVELRFDYVRDLGSSTIPKLGHSQIAARREDRKSTRLNSSHRCISYAVFFLKKKNKNNTLTHEPMRQNHSQQ